MASKRQKLRGLFAQGFKYSSDEAKKIAKSRSTRETYWYEWKNEGMPGFVAEAAAEKLQDEDKPEHGNVESEKVTLEQVGKRPAGFDILEAQFRVAPKQGHISIGHISFPYEDMGYSSIANLLVVASTYDQVCKPTGQGGFGYEGKFGDFCADCVVIWRRIFGYDRMREEDIQYAEQTGVKLLDGPSPGEDGGGEPKDESGDGGDGDRRTGQDQQEHGRELVPEGQESGG